jgi:acyl CoA:acetate/3-ketoacid CoA transferase alpha subunit
MVNGLGISGVSEALVHNKFHAGTKGLEFYSYNYAVPRMEDTDMRFIFV